MSLCKLGEQGWRSGESTRLPPMWPGFDSRPRFHMWAEFVVGARPCSEGFSPGTPVFLPPQKPTFPNSIWNQWTKSHFVEVPLQIPMYLFYLFIYLCKLSRTSFLRSTGNTSFLTSFCCVLRDSRYNKPT